MTDDFVFGKRNTVTLTEADHQITSDVSDYNHHWRERKASDFQKGTEDNLWWFVYRKYLKERGVITELEFKVNNMYEAVF